MTEPRYRTKREPNRKPLIVIGVVAGFAILVVLLLSGGKDDPVANDLLPPINMSVTGTTGTTGATEETVIDSNGQEIPASAGAIDGKGVTAVKPDPEPELSNAPHEDSGIANPAGEATAVGPYVDTATRFADLSLNRPNDPSGARDLDKQLIQLSTGTLARDLARGTGAIQTAQVASQGSVLSVIPLAKEGDYAEVLVVAKQTVVDSATGQTLDPKFLNYIVRLERVPGGDFAVTSWEPQL